MKERIQQLLIAMGYTATRLADEIKVQRSGISHILSGRNLPSYDFITRLLTRFPEINARWLLTGEGNMYIKEKNDENTLKTPETGINEELSMVESEDPAPYKVTNVTKANNVTRVILLHSDGTFEDYKPFKKQ